jgi:hypothetical protein
MKKATWMKITMYTCLLVGGVAVAGDFCGYIQSVSTSPCKGNSDCLHYTEKTPGDQYCYGPGQSYCRCGGVSVAQCQDYSGGSCLAGYGGYCSGGSPSGDAYLCAYITCVADGQCGGA